MNTLDASTLESALKDLPDWSGDPTGITATFTFPDFAAAIAFMVAVAPGIDERNHHPEWSNVYNRLTVVLKTHDAGDVVTDKDIDLAGFLSHEYAGLA